MPSAARRSEVNACSTGSGIAAVWDATVLVKPNGRSTLSDSRSDIVRPVAFSSARPSST